MNIFFTKLLSLGFTVTARNKHGVGLVGGQ